VQSVSCAGGMGGSSFLFACPRVRPVPACLWWDAPAARWSGEGCVVVNASATSVTCACDHLTEFAARFAALAEQQEAVFAQNARLVEPSTYALNPGIFVVILTLAVLTAAGAILGRC
jgi:hypothetical protein